MSIENNYKYKIIISIYIYTFIHLHVVALEISDFRKFAMFQPAVADMTGGESNEPVLVAQLDDVMVPRQRAAVGRCVSLVREL